MGAGWKILVNGVGTDALYIIGVLGGFQCNSKIFNGTHVHLPVILLRKFIEPENLRKND